MTYERIKERYLKNYITDAQLERFKALGIITEAQYTELLAASIADAIIGCRLQKLP